MIDDDFNFNAKFLGYFDNFLKSSFYLKLLNFNKIKLRIFDHFINQPFLFKNVELYGRKEFHIIQSNKTYKLQDNDFNATNKAWIEHQNCFFPVLGCYQKDDITIICSYPNMKTFAKLYELNKVIATQKMINLISCSPIFVERIMNVYYGI